MPVYNRTRFVRAAIDSILAQTMHDFELLVVDDGSTDDSVACIAAVSDPRLRLLRRPHAGISATMNAGLSAARGEYVARLDSDDLWRPELLAMLVPLLDARPDAAAVSARALCITADGTPTAHHLGMQPRQPEDSLGSLLWDDFTCNIATLARRACLERAGGYDESLAVSEDWDLWLRVARQAPILFDDRVLAYVRWHDDNITGIYSPLFRRMLDERARVLDKQFADPNLPARAAALRAQAYANVHLAAGLRWLVARDVRAAARAFGRALAASDDRPITAARIVWRVASVCILERHAWGRRLLDWQSAVRRRRQTRRTACARRRRIRSMPTCWHSSSPETACEGGTMTLRLKAQIDAATAYEGLFVPALFQEWAPRVVAAAQLRRGQRVLDVACGTGVLARESALCVGATGAVVGLDPMPGMLAVAKRLAPEIQWREGMAEALPYPDRSFDAVVSQFGLMFFTDRHQALCEMVRVLVPGGHLAVAVWDSLENTPAYAAEVALLERVAGQRAADALRAPFVLGDRQELAALFTSAGVAAVAITTHHGTADFPSVRSMVEADLRGWLPVMGVVLPEHQINRVLEEAEHALSPYVTAEGRVRFEAPAHIVTGTRP